MSSNSSRHDESGASDPDRELEDLNRTEYRGVCSEGCESSWYSKKSLALEWEEVHNGAPDPVHGKIEPCPEGGSARIEERYIDTGIEHSEADQ